MVNGEQQTCATADCRGVPLMNCFDEPAVRSIRCLVHAEEQKRQAALAALAEGRVLDFTRGIPISAELLSEILTAAPTASGHPVLNKADFRQSEFKDSAEFQNVVFEGDALFNAATFDSRADFSGATFRGSTGFLDVIFHDNAHFAHANFQSVAAFVRSKFLGETSFIRAVFNSAAGFAWVTFQGAFRFNRARVQDLAQFAEASFVDTAQFDESNLIGMASFRQTNFAKEVTFNGTTFADGLTFSSTIFWHSAYFVEAKFEEARVIGPVVAYKRLSFDHATFTRRVEIQASTAALCCRRTRFLGGAYLRTRWAFIVLDDADFAGPSLLTGVRLNDEAEAKFSPMWERLSPGRRHEPDRPRLVSVRGADVGNLTISNVDVQSTLFLGSHNLDKLHTEARCTFPRSPSSWRWASRITLAEEHHWRENYYETQGMGLRKKGWNPPHVRSPVWISPDSSAHQPTEIASLYRALRKSREDSKDEPGAGDFYYGEMEMRRHAKREEARREWRNHALGTWSSAASEYLILSLYWLISGYALRAWRALTTLIVIIVLSAMIFAFVGFESPKSTSFVPVGVTRSGRIIYEEQSDQSTTKWKQLPQATLYSAEAATSLLRAPSRPLTPIGGWTQVALRLLGPVLLGLTILSLRGRVKR
jgi:uncharacterized protein YjbI with pentapeptide repeats